MAIPSKRPCEEISIRAMRESDVREADRVIRLAFGTFIGLPDPMTFMGNAEYARTRWRADPSAAFAAEAGGELVGSVFAANWGSVGLFGPLTVRPDYWDGGIGKLLLAPVMDLFTSWGTRHAGLYTMAHSPKHVALYQAFGYRPRFLTAIMSRPISGSRGVHGAFLLSEVLASEQEGCLAMCRDLAGAVYEGLDLSVEIRTVAEQGLGDTVLLWDHGKLQGFAVCHVGAGTEAGSGSCYVKFGAALPGPSARGSFDALLGACGALGAGRGAAKLDAGVNTARSEAYGAMLEAGFRIQRLGIAMHRPDEPGYSRPGVYAVDDWR